MEIDLLPMPFLKMPEKNISLNGTAAHKADIGDFKIVCTYMMGSKDDKFQEPKILKIED